MTLLNNKYRIESACFKNWDYRNADAYYYTICNKNREHLSRENGDDEMIFSDVGLIINNLWLEIVNHFPTVHLGAHIVMPNHVHGIIILDSAVKMLHCYFSTVGKGKNQFMSNVSAKPGSGSTIIQSYKSACKKWINQNVDNLNFARQPPFHDHIIRNHYKFIRIENYIINNPKIWTNDKFYQ